MKNIRQASKTEKNRQKKQKQTSPEKIQQREETLYTTLIILFDTQMTRELGNNLESRRAG